MKEASMRKTVYVIGHKNPDMDSIASAIAYSELKRKDGYRAIPARNGDLDIQSEYILKKLGISPPMLLTDVSLRVKDVMTTKVISVNPQTSLRDALKILEEKKIRILPIVEEKRPVGILTLYRIAKEYFLRTGPSKIKKIRTSEEILIKTLHGKKKGKKNKDIKSYNLCIVDEEIDVKKNCIAIVPEKNLLRKARNAEIVILPKEIVKEINHKNLLDNVILSSYDLVTTTLFTSLSLPVAFISSKRYDYCYLNERVRDIRKQLFESDQKGLLVLNTKGFLKGIVTKTDLFKDKKKKLILVDHNEKTQAPYGIEDSDIIEVVDHHKIGDIMTDKPIRFIVENVGSTSTLIAREYRSRGIKPSIKIAKLLLAGILSDTVVLQSPTTTPLDKEIVQWLSKIGKVDIDKMGRELFNISISGKDIGSLLRMDLKKFLENNKSFAISNIFVTDFKSIMPYMDDIRREVEKYIEKHNLYFFIVMITNVMKKESLLLYTGPRGIMEKTGYIETDKDLYIAPGLLSRKKQLLPKIITILKGF